MYLSHNYWSYQHFFFSLKKQKKCAKVASENLLPHKFWNFDSFLCSAEVKVLSILILFMSSLKMFYNLNYHILFQGSSASRFRSVKRANKVSWWNRPFQSFRHIWDKVVTFIFQILAVDELWQKDKIVWSYCRYGYQPRLI